MSGEYVFENKNDLVSYLYGALSNPTQIKVQKTLYLLYAFYGATYGQIVRGLKDDEFDEQAYPETLFNANFQAWRYGPVEFDVYTDEKKGVFDEVEEQTLKENTPEEKNIKQFIESIVNQTDNIDDFSLVDRTHQDEVWLSNYVEGERYIEICNEEIINEYKKRYVKNA